MKLFFYESKCLFCNNSNIYISEYKPKYIIILLTYIWKLARNFMLDSSIIKLYNVKHIVSSIFLISMNTDIYMYVQCKISNL